MARPDTSRAGARLDPAGQTQRPITNDDVPRGDEGKEYFLWHIRTLPRLTTPAGFELGSGMSINTVVPEDAAAIVREVPAAFSAHPAEPEQTRGS